MKRTSFAIVGAAGLLLAACSGNSDDAANADANATSTGEFELSNESANDAASSMESDTLANQAAQLNAADVDDSNASANADVPATASDDEAMNVAGM